MGGAENDGGIELFRSLSIRIQKRELLRDQSMTVSPGTITVLMGPSGVGKSILSDVVFGLRDHGSDIATSGSIGNARVEGALVFQEGGGLPHLTVQENLSLVSPSDDHQAAVEQSFGLNADQLASNLSGGERRRLSVARSLIAGRRILWLDEPDAGLDLKRLRDLATMLKAQCREQQLALVVTTHNTTFAAEIADTVLFMSAEGKVVELPVNAQNGSTHDGLVQELSIALESEFDTSSRDTDGRSAPARRIVRSLTQELDVARWLMQIPHSVPSLLSTLRNRPALRTFLQSLSLSALRGAAYYPFIGAIFGAVFVLVFLFAVPFLPPATIISEYGGTIVMRFSPPLAAILAAACAGSTIASWVGQMTAGRQLDALLVLGAPVSRWVVGPVWWGLALACVVNTLTFALAISCVFGGYILAVSGGELALEFWSSFTGSRSAGTGTHLLAALVKTVGYGMLVAAVTVGCATGALRSQADVAAAVTRGIVWSSIVVMAVELFVLLFDQWLRV